jgi:molybdate transport system substrate-binding protein
MYATGRIVLWSRNDSKVDVSRGLAVVTDPQVRRIAVANPAHAPYGRAAVAALRHDHLYDEVRSKLVLGENISQAAQFAQSGNAEVGILALSLALSPTLKSAGRYFEIPASSYPPIEQAGAVVSASRQTALAHRFLAALKAPSAERTLGAFGFSVPTAAR